jgi:hypothetical protein
MAQQTLIPKNAADSLIAHVRTLRRERAYIAHIYSEYDGSKTLDALLEEAGDGILGEVRDITELVKAGANVG